MDKIIINLELEKNISIAISDVEMEMLKEKALANLNNSGRGVGNIVESLFINPLSRYLFDNELFSDVLLTIDEINVESHIH